MLTNWSDPTKPATAGWADYRGLEMARNQVICRASCDIGMQPGSENFVVYGGGQETMVDGAEPWHAVF